MNRLVKVYTSTLSCEAILRKLGNGDYIIVSQCGGEKEPDIENRIYLFRSIDAGKTWGAPVALYEDGSAVYQTEVSIIGNKICIFVTTHNGKFLNNKHFCLSAKIMAFIGKKENWEYLSKVLSLSEG